ncbi:diguanylate cyclase [Paraliobacillus ryukyuensis]|uniref:diguanylate cyclase n=1 Tax=Paraliobacillus ryukyuensis TaxID=200904 RepID=UPI0009A8C368
MLSNCSKTEVLKIAERVCETAEIKPFYIDSRMNKNNITVSIGLATFFRGIQPLDDIYRIANQWLYRAKTNGRNQVKIVKNN